MKNRQIAMWSGPRNISTAMMRSWGNRSDTTVIDEPFYAHYLNETGVAHPGAADIIASQPTDWREVVANLTADNAADRPVYYQKHITTHMLGHITLDWLAPMTHCFLIRDPAKVVASYNQQYPEGAATDLGYQQQSQIYEHICQHIDSNPVVIDSDLFLQNPTAQLRALCQRIGLDYTDEMLTWEPGIRETDGVWHTWWYSAVAKSTGFNPWQPKTPNLSVQQQKVVSECERYYNNLRSHALTN